MGHVLDTDGRGDGGGFVEGGRDKELGHNAVEEDLRHLRSRAGWRERGRLGEGEGEG